MIVTLVTSLKLTLKYPVKIKEETINFPLASENNVIPTDKENDYMNKIEPKNFPKAKNFKMWLVWQEKLLDSL